MAKALIIVESPAKIKTLKKFLGPNYVFESSLGHVRDLPEKEFGIDLEHDFEPQYQTLPTKERVIARLIEAAKECDIVYLSPDPDREGEAIAWHIAQILPPDVKVKRTAFHSITKQAVQEALAAPRDINQDLVDAQQARRLLDRIVGYKISPILARRVLGGRRGGQSVSAGRVQSVALKLVVDREALIEAFEPVEYWTLTAELQQATDGHSFRATLFSIDGKRVEKEPIPDKEVALVADRETAEGLKRRLEKSSFSVEKIERKEKRRHPVAPFITSTLQQEASRHFGFSSARTMNVAQTLYEGVDLDSEGAEGLITYMRTDSVRVAPEAIHAVRRLIERDFGPEFVPDKPRLYSTKKTAQDAHEAIRPTNLSHPPDKVSRFLTREQYQLYSLIWKRFVASQMTSAIYDTMSVDVSAGDGLMLRATGSIVKFRGFLAVYEEKRDEEEADEQVHPLPPLKEKEPLKLMKVDAEQSFTRPPPRFTEASLVKELEKSGIGRPSTYATIMNKIQSREFTIKEHKALKPTELGRVCAALLEVSFPGIMSIHFTADMEDRLEQVADGEAKWREVVRAFWQDFEPVLKKAEQEAHVPRVLTDLNCPKCGHLLQKIWSRSRYFYGCTHYPDCDFTSSIEAFQFDKADYHPDFDWEQPCPLCASPMKVRHGRFGAFLGCLRYPECRGTVHIPRKGEEAVEAHELPHCPAKGCPGKLTARRSRFGKIFYSCSTFPECDVIVNKLEEIAIKYADHPRTPYQKKPRKTKKKSQAGKGGAASTRGTRAAAMRRLSPELAAVVGAAELSRGDCMKALWAYIKKHDLQDPSDKRVIVPDDKMAALFGSREPVNMFKLAGIVAAHLR
jgi:DNA topoisomerase I